MIHAGPAIITIAEAEQQCIRIAQGIKLDSLKAELKRFSLWRIDCSGVMPPDFEWQPGRWENIKKVMLLTVVLPLIVSLLLAAYVLTVCEKLKRLIMLVIDILHLKSSLNAPFAVPEEKTIWELWRWYGLEDSFNEEEQLNLLSIWVETLYGAEVRQRFDFKQMTIDIRKRNIEANIPYYEGNPEAPKFFFNKPASSLAIGLSGILPPYM